MLDVRTTINDAGEETGYVHFFKPFAVKILGTFAATLELWVADNDAGEGAVMVKSYTVPVVDIVDVPAQFGLYANIKCTAYTSGSAIVRMWE
jgi:hypothetical protein